MSLDPRRPVTTPGRQVTLLLLGILLAVNAAAVWGIVQARRSARGLALEDLEWQTRAQARAVEAALAALRGDFIYLSRTPPLSRVMEVFRQEDPVARRWGRLEAEGALLLFLEAHPPVERLVVLDPAGEALVVAGRREGAPVLLPPAAPPPLPGGREWVRAAWPLGAAAEGAGRLETALDPQGVVAQAAPGFEERLEVRVGEAAGPAPEATDDRLTARARVEAPGWPPPLAWTLTRREPEGGLLRSIQSLAGLFGTAVAVNVAVIALTLALALLAFRQVRRAAALAAENQHQARLRELERQLFHSERLASLGRLAAGVAHEVNNPLEGMANYLLVLEEDLQAGRTEGAADLAARVREGVERIAGITRRVLTFAAPGKAPKSRLDLGEVLRHNVRFLAANPLFREVDLRLETPPEPVEVVGDATTLGQLVLNLLLNAAQVQGEKGVVEVTLEADGDRARLVVVDRGPGLSDEALSHAFEPFFSTRDSSGLGLAVCRGIAQDHGGAIRVANRPEGGARFEVELPRAEAAQEPSALEARPA